jgi:hypothetical protein
MVKDFTAEEWKPSAGIQTHDRADWSALPSFKPLNNPGVTSERRLPAAEIQRTQSAVLSARRARDVRKPAIRPHRWKFSALASVSLSTVLSCYIIACHVTGSVTAARPAAVEAQGATAVTNPQPPLIDALLARGHALTEAGDIARARLMYQTAAELGSGRGALLSGQTYDPNALRHIARQGNWQDATQAKLWYERAADLGESAGELWLRRLELSRLVESKAVRPDPTQITASGPKQRNTAGDPAPNVGAGGRGLPPR